MTESGDEEETEGVVNQVLDEIGIEISGKVKPQYNQANCFLNIIETLAIVVASR